jgi:hypothetical protein
MVMNAAERAIENTDYIRRLLEEKQPEFATSLKLAASAAERTLRESAAPPWTVRSAETA